MNDYVVVVTRPGTPEREVHACEGPVVVGRSLECQITLHHPLVSRRHLEVAPAPGGGVVIRDLGSRNGTFVNGERCAEGETAVDGVATINIGPFQLVVTPAEAMDGDTTLMAAETVIGRAYLDRGLRTLFVDGLAVVENLAGREYALLDRLSRDAPNLVPTAGLGDEIWGEGQWDVYMLHNLVRRVRKKIERGLGRTDEIVITVAGVGYRLA